MGDYEDLFSVLASTGTILAVTIIILFLILAVIYVLQGIAYYKMFKKAGMANPVLRAFVPYYNTWSIVELSECHWWYFIIVLASSIVTVLLDNSSLAFISLLINLVVIYVQFCINYNIAKKFNQGTGFAIGMTLLPLIFYMILGFSKNYEYNNNVKLSKWGFYDFENKQANTKEKKYCPDCGSEMSGNFCPKCGKKGE